LSTTKPLTSSTDTPPGRTRLGARTALLAVVLLWAGHLSALVGLIASNAQAGVALHFRTTQIAWFTLGSSLVGFFFMPFVIKAAAFYGKRKVLLAITVAGLVGDLIAALATSFGVLVVGRSITGLYIGVGTALVYALIRDIFPKDQVGPVTGLYSAGTSVMSLFGPFLAGWLIDDYGFRAGLWFMVGATAVAAVLIALFVPESPVREPRTSFDWAGGLLLGAGLTSVIYGINKGPAWGWTNGGVLGFLIGGTAGILAFLVVERYVAQPIFPITLLRRREIWSILLSTSLGTGALFSLGTITYLLALYPAIPHLSAGLGFSVTKNAVIGLPGGILLIGVAIFAGRLARRTDPRKLLAVGAFFFIVWTVLYVFFHHSAAQLIAIAPVGAIGGGLALASGPVMIMSVTSVEEQVLVNGAFSMTSGVVGSVLSALTFALLAGHGTVVHGVQFYSEASYRDGFWMYAGIGVLTLASIALIPRVRRLDEADIGLESTTANTAA
jgi:MFS family permease